MSTATFDNRLARRVEARLSSNEFAALLKRQADYLSRVRGEKLGPEEVERLDDFITQAVLVFYGLKREDQFNLHEVSEPIGVIIELLTLPANLNSVLVALGAPTHLWLSSDNDRIKKAVNKHNALIRDLKKIAQAAPKPLEKRKKGGQVTPKEDKEDIERCASVLAICWEMLSGQPFSQSWLDLKESKLRGYDVRVPPALSGAMFVFDVIEFLDPDRLDRVPKITEALVNARTEAEMEVRKTPKKSKAPRRKPRPRKAKSTSPE